MATRPTVHSFYRYNIEPRLLEAQKRVFDHFDVPLKQWRNDNDSHGSWMDSLLADDSLDDTVVVADIDAFPMSYAAYENIVAKAEAGAIAGLAQNTLDKDTTKIFAAPMFLAFRRDVHREFGSPSLMPYAEGDVAQIMTDIAHEKGVKVDLLYPTFAMRPHWALADYGVYGTGTFYGEREFFHLYRSRFSYAVDLFCAVADGTIAGRHDWNKYLKIVEHAPPLKTGRNFTQIMRKLSGRFMAR
ncbi:MAG: hypothetical protein AAF252_06980 [Pseudomonadota bacterium]